MPTGRDYGMMSWQKSTRSKLLNPRAFLLIILFFMLACATSDGYRDGLIRISSLPDPGESVRELIESVHAPGSLPSNVVQQYEVLYEGAVFTLSVFGDSARVVAVSTTDPSFVTREGIRVGSTLSEVLSAGGSSPDYSQGMGGYVTELPSGWLIGYTVISWTGRDGYVEGGLEDDTPVGSIYKQE